MSALTWEKYEPPETCGATRGRGRVACELPPGHDRDKSDWPDHLGRGRDGRWISWAGSSREADQ